MVYSTLTYGGVSALTKKQKLILRYITQDHLTIKQIAHKTRTTKSNIYQIINRIKKNGSQYRHYELVKKRGVTSDFNPKNSGFIKRVHGSAIRIKILVHSKKYFTYLAKSNYYYYHGSPILLYQNSLIAYVKEDFYSELTDSALINRADFIDNMVRVLEHDLGVTLVKHRYTNIKIFRSHIANIGSSIARDYNERGERLIVKDRFDGKICIIVDKSKGFDELEFIHPKSNKEDEEKISRFLDDLKTNNVPFLSYMWRKIKYLENELELIK